MTDLGKSVRQQIVGHWGHSASRAIRGVMTDGLYSAGMVEMGRRFGGQLFANLQPAIIRGVQWGTE